MMLRCLFIFFAFYSTAIFASERYRILESTRFFSRGNTFIAANDSDEATSANPATLAEAEKLTWQLRWFQSDFFIGENPTSTINDLVSLTPNDTAIDILNKFSDKFGKRQSGRIQLLPFGLRIFSFELSPFFSTYNFADLRLPTLPEVRFVSDTYTGVNIAYAMKFGSNYSVGLNVRPMSRILFDGDMAFSDVLDFVDSSSMELDDLIKQQEGSLIGVNVGVNYTPNKTDRYGLLIENLGHTSDTGSADNAPPPIPMSVGLGMLKRWNLKSWNLDFLLDIQDIINPNNYNYFRLIHLGTEFGTSLFTRDNDLGILAGINEGYFTTGAYVDFWLAKFTLSYYAVELGEYPGQRKDRRWGLSLHSAMTF